MNASGCPCRTGTRELTGTGVKAALRARYASGEDALRAMSNAARAERRLALFLFNEIDALVEQDTKQVAAWRHMNEQSLARFVHGCLYVRRLAGEAGGPPLPLHRGPAFRRQGPGPGRAFGTGRYGASGSPRRSGPRSALAEREGKDSGLWRTPGTELPDPLGLAALRGAVGPSYGEEAQRGAEL